MHHGAMLSDMVWYIQSSAATSGGTNMYPYQLCQFSTTGIRPVQVHRQDPSAAHLALGQLLVQQTVYTPRSCTVGCDSSLPRLLRQSLTRRGALARSLSRSPKQLFCMYIRPSLTPHTPCISNASKGGLRTLPNKQYYFLLPSLPRKEAFVR